MYNLDIGCLLIGNQMNRFAEIEAFVAVIETGSFSAAAARQGVAISAISRRIDEMEARLNVKLTRRSSRGVKATEEGHTYYDRCLRLLSDLTEADNVIAGREGSVSGPIRIACPPAFGLRYLAPLANAYAASNPGVQFDLDVSDRSANLVEEGFDFAIRIGHTDDPALVSEPLFPVQHVITASPDFWDKFGRPNKPEDLQGFPAVTYRIGLDPARWRFTGPNHRTVEVCLSPRYIANDGKILIEAAKAGLGVCLEPKYACYDAIREGALEAVLSGFRIHERMAELVRPNVRPLSRRAGDFANILRERFATTAPWDDG
jgi:DNA-binding transcriptional LysR family regulator